jgi:hypothetical protein
MLHNFCTRQVDIKQSRRSCEVSVSFRSMYLCRLLAGLHLHHCRETAQTGWLPGSLLPLLISAAKHAETVKQEDTATQPAPASLQSRLLLSLLLVLAVALHLCSLLTPFALPPSPAYQSSGE